MNIFANIKLSDNVIEEETFKIDENLLKIYQKQKRNSLDNEKLYEKLKNFPYFQNILQNNQYGDLMCRSFIEKMRIKVLKYGDIIYRVHQSVSSIIFLLEGKIVVYKPPKKYKAKKNNSPNKRLRFIEKMKLAFQNFLSAQINRVPDYFIEKGKLYGINLLNDNKHKVLVESISNCVIGELYKSDYILIFEKTELLEKNDILNFLSNLKVFNDINKKLFRNLFKYIHKKKCKKEEIICERNKKFNKIFFIRRGSFEIFINNHIKIQNNYNLENFENKNKSSTNFLMTEQQKYTNADIFGNAKIKYEINNYYDDIIKYHLLEYGRGEIIGDLEYKYNFPYYLFNIKCVVENSLILSINLLDFLNRDLYLFRLSFTQETERKLNYFKNRINEIKNVNKFRIDAQNKYKNIILNKIEKNKGEAIKLLESKEFNKQKYKRKKNLSLEINIDKIKKNINENKMKKKNCYYNFTKNYASIFLKNLSDNDINSADVEIKNFLPNIKKKRMSSAITKNLFKKDFKLKSRNFSNDNYDIKSFISLNKTNNTSAKDNRVVLITTYNESFKKKINNFKNIKINEQRISLLKEHRKNNFPHTCEINKDFFINNNMTLLRKDLNNIFMIFSKK